MTETEAGLMRPQARGSRDGRSPREPGEGQGQSPPAEPPGEPALRTPRWGPFGLQDGE